MNQDPVKKQISIIGGGSAALILATELDASKFEVKMYEKNSALGRKFLVAGDGGFNLTHSENESSFVLKYSPSDFLTEHFHRFSNVSFIKWLNDKGIETFIGSSGRVFPKKGIKPVEVLNVIVDNIKKNKALIQTKHEWMGFSDTGNLLFKHGGQLKEIKTDVTVFCMGGASWPVTGSKGDWSRHFTEKGIAVHSFFASNCAYKINWPSDLIPSIEGKALKNCSFSCGSKEIRGEAVLTAFGIEGSGIYPLSPVLREQLKERGMAEIKIDLKPDLSEKDLLLKLQKKTTNENYTQSLIKHLNLNRSQITLLKHFTSKEDFLDPIKLAHTIKHLHLTVSGTDAIENAISTVGGIAIKEIDENFQLKKLPKHFVIGEMLDFDAPTGGYLLQACYTMAESLAHHLNNKLT